MDGNLDPCVKFSSCCDRIFLKQPCLLAEHVGRLVNECSVAIAHCLVVSFLMLKHSWYVLYGIVARNFSVMSNIEMLVKHSLDFNNRGTIFRNVLTINA
jgi:hypothetical protein